MGKAYLQRPSALTVIGGLCVAVYGFSIVDAALDLYRLEELRPAVAAIGSRLSAEAIIVGTIATSLLLTIAGGGLLARAPWGRWATTGASAISIAFGYLIFPSAFILALYAPLFAALVWRLHAVDDKDSPQSEANVVLVAFSAGVLLYAGMLFGMGGGALALGPFLPADPIEPSGPGFNLIAFAVGGVCLLLSALLWAIGAAIFKFRWLYATIGWTVLCGSLICLYAAASVAWFRFFPEAMSAAPADIADFVAATPTAPLIGVGLGFAALGAWCVWRQWRLEATQRLDSLDRVSEAFR